MTCGDRKMVARLRGYAVMRWLLPRHRGTSPPRNHSRSDNAQRRHLLMQIRPLDVEQSGGLDVIPVRSPQHALDVLLLALLLELAQREDLGRDLGADQRLGG